MIIEVLITDNPLALPDKEHVPSGAIARFTGIVRPEEDGAQISALLYEAYEPMATQTIQHILTTLHREHGFDAARVHHRLGTIPVGEAAIIIEVTSKHRAAAFAVVSEFMDRLKIDVPIWKVEAVQA